MFKYLPRTEKFLIKLNGIFDKIIECDYAEDVLTEEEEYIRLNPILHLAEVMWNDLGEKDSEDLANFLLIMNK